MRQDNHRWDVVRAVRRYMALQVTGEPIEGEATPGVSFAPQQASYVTRAAMEACNQSLNVSGESWHLSQ